MPNQDKKSQTPIAASSVLTRRPSYRRKGTRGKGPIATSTKQMAGYFTVSGIENEISLPEKNWPCFALKELSDNACDWINDYYPAAANNDYASRRHIQIRIRIDQIANDPHLTRVFRIAVRNSNADQIEVFDGGRTGLEQIFDYTQWLSTKRHQHRMTAGSLGDYLKRHGGMGYASWNNTAPNTGGDNNFDNDDDNNIQWEEPLIFRFNGSEYKVFVYYDKYTGFPKSVIKYAGKSDAVQYTEVECALPVSRINCNGNGDDSDPVALFDKLYEYYTRYKIAKPDVKFSLEMQYEIMSRHITEEDD